VQAAEPEVIVTVPQPVIVVLPNLNAIVPVAPVTTVALNSIDPLTVVAVLLADMVVAAPPLSPTTTGKRTDLVTPTVSVALTRIEYVAAARLDETETTPEELIVIPLTVELSEVLTTDQLQEEVDPVPPEIVGVEVFADPKVVETLG
jgi:hypothetical protein